MSSGSRAGLRERGIASDSPMVHPLESPDGPTFEAYSAEPHQGFRLPRANIGRLASEFSLLSETRSEDSLVSMFDSQSFSSFSTDHSEQNSPRELQHSVSSVRTAPSTPDGSTSRSASLLRLNSYHRTSSGDGQEQPFVVVVAWNILYTTVRTRKALDCPEVARAMNAVYIALDCEEPDVGAVDTLFDHLHQTVAVRTPVQDDPMLLQALSNLKGAIATMPDELAAVYRDSLRS